MASSTAVTVTVFVSSQFAAVKLSDPGLTVAVPVSPELTVTVTAAVGSVASFTVYVAVRPVPAASVTVTLAGVATRPRVSSSADRQRPVRPGSATPLPPLAVTGDRHRPVRHVSTSLSTAAIVTVPVLAVEPAAIVSVRVARQRVVSRHRRAHRRRRHRHHHRLARRARQRRRHRALATVLADRGRAQRQAHRRQGLVVDDRPGRRRRAELRATARVAQRHRQRLVGLVHLVARSTRDGDRPRSVASAAKVSVPLPAV